MIALLLYLTLSNAFASEPRLPDLYFSYSFLYDNASCESTPPKAEWITELRSKMNHLDEVWNVRGPVLFQVLFDYSGLGFSRKEMDATLSLCAHKSSYSSPLVLNATYFLDSFTAPIPAGSDDKFADLVFHELIHTWVVENLESSQLRIKYKDEANSVKSHLHLMAIQQFVYLKLNRPDLIEMIAKQYNGVGGDYARSWEIVQTEGYQAFINELPKK